MDRNTLPVAIIGAGPVGLAAAAHLHERAMPFVLFEAGDDVGASVREWAHVQLFSPWRHNVDDAARRLLERSGWSAPDPGVHPTGHALIAEYLDPLASLPEIAAHLRTNQLVVSVTRAGMDKVRTGARADAPFVVTTDGPHGPQRTLAAGVIDASGTWAAPNPIGANGVPALGEHAASDRIDRGIPDVLGVDRWRFAGRRIAVVGSGHSAQNVVRDLSVLADRTGTDVAWVVRRRDVGLMFGGGDDDQLAERGRLGAASRGAVDTGVVRLETGFGIDAVVPDADGVVLVSADGRSLGPFDRIVAATGFRPDLSPLRELRVDLDPALESPRALAPLIDPNVHSCGSVPPHGARELAHPEADLYVVGAKSYGRAPTFLLATGYEQVRSVVAALAGDHAAAADVRLSLPETGVCSVERGGPAAVAGAGACCN